jgi:hypothetical protein
MPKGVVDIEGIEHIGNPRFLELNELEREIHIAKAAGYSGSDNPDTWGNFRESEGWGVSPLKGCLVRMGDKYRRAQNLLRNPDNDRVGESLMDTLMDMSNYCKIAICLWEEEQAQKKAMAEAVASGQWPIKNPNGTAKNAHETFDAVERADRVIDG